jgi:predicted ATPase/class 3 adenylate cyclase
MGVHSELNAPSLDLTMPDYPSGTVTFLFTDIEGSTARWEQNRAAMEVAVQRHLVLLDAAIEANGGVHFKTVGDAVQAAFPTAAQGMAAAVAAQQALSSEPWPAALGPLRVRIALHAAAATPVDGDYLAPSLNRLSRLLLVSHGGQVVLTETVRRLLDNALAPETSLRDLGEHRLRDLLEPERVWQVVAPGLPADFPPLRSLTVRPHNLPPPLTPLIGREPEVTTLVQVFRDGARLVTVTGAGGTGKTRLALEAAAELLEDFPDGVWFLDLAGLTDPALLLPQIAATLEVRQSGEQPLAERLADFLAGRRVLLVLDNLEQFRPYDELGRVVAGLVVATPGLAILATSRAPLQLRIEHEFPLPPLPVPAARESTVAVLAESPAVQLFVSRAQAVRPSFTLGPHNATAIAALCRRLDGLPLALELAAARVRALTPADILHRLGSRLDLLADGGADRPDRQRTLEATIAWSFGLLMKEHQAAFRRLAVFSGGCTFDAAETVLAAFADPPVDGLSAVTTLVEQGLLRDEEQADGTLRFRMLETVRAFGLDRLLESGEEDAARHAHADYFRALLERAFPEGKAFGDEPAWLGRLDAEHDNLRAALEATAMAGDPSQLLAFAVHCWYFWWPRGYWTDARIWLEQALARSEDVPTIERAQALRALGLIADATGDGQRGVMLVEASQQRFQALGDRQGEWQTLLDLSLLWAARDYGEAGRYAEQALAVAREAGDPVMIARSLNRLGNWQANREHPQEAIARHEEALRILEGLGDERGIAETLDLLGVASIIAGENAGAAYWYARAIPLWRQLGDWQGLAESLIGCTLAAHSPYTGTLAAAMTTQEARVHGEEGLILVRGIGWRAGESYALWAYHGMLLGGAGEYATALPSAREALTIARDIDHAQWIVAARYVLATLLADLGDFPAAWDELRAALILAQDIQSAHLTRIVAGTLVSTLAAGGREDEAQVVLDASLIDDTSVRTLAGRALWCAAADLALATGDPSQALQIADRLLQADGGSRVAIPRVELLRAESLITLGRDAEAEQALQVAHDAAVWCGARPLQWRILAAWGRLAEKQGRSEEAHQAVAAAQSLIAELAAVVPDEALRTRFLKRAAFETRHCSAS